jgi:hypothetical protein
MWLRDSLNFGIASIASSGGLVLSPDPGPHTKPPIFVSCRGKDGRNDALVATYACNCSYDPPMGMVGVVPSRIPTASSSNPAVSWSTLSLSP